MTSVDDAVATDSGGAGHPAGPVRVDLVFEPGSRRVRVPHGVTLFDAASWNGIAIDSTCGGHGTCKKCKVRVLDDGADPPSSLDARSPQIIRAVKAADLLLDRDPWGASWIAAHRAQQAAAASATVQAAP